MICPTCKRGLPPQWSGEKVQAVAAAANALTDAERKCEEVQKTLRDTANALEEVLSADSDMPSHESTIAHADAQLEAARLLLAALPPPAPQPESKDDSK